MTGRKGTGWNPTRRNRNIGTAKSGHGKDNWMVVPWSRHETVFRPWEKLGAHTTVERTVHGRPFTFIVEHTQEGHIH